MSLLCRDGVAGGGWRADNGNAEDKGGECMAQQKEEWDELLGCGKTASVARAGAGPASAEPVT